MARARNIKPGFFKNEVLAELSFEQRLLFIGLWTLADREGRLEDRPKRIKAELFAFDSVDVEPMLVRLEAEGFLIRYQVGATKYIHITNFVKHQDPHYKEKASEIPPPPGFENEVKATNVTRTQRQRILERDGFKCLECGSDDHLSIDHVIPISRGGDSSDENLQVLCLRCNTSKSNKMDGEDRARKRPKQGILPGSIYDVQRRPDVDPTLSGAPVDAGASAPLTPDSGFPLPDSPTQGERASKPARRPAIRRPDDVTERTWMDWQQLRRQKRAPVTETVVEGAREQSALAGLSLEQFLKVWCRRGSQGLEAAWLKPEERGRAPPAEPQWRTEQRQRTQLAAPGVAVQNAPDFFDVEARNVASRAMGGPDFRQADADLRAALPPPLD